MNATRGAAKRDPAPYDVIPNRVEDSVRNLLFAFVALKSRFLTGPLARFGMTSVGVGVGYECRPPAGMDPFRIVILSGVRSARSALLTQSKDPYDACGV